ncbi:hypothetical protein RN001_001173 [Aquatica leii]|uniref:DDE Tnp4 domain-containing protein n=1 Tax=Aquatica leii TaxID=1421715 RepID=A0AAN7Q7P7_9COLE|nr:hypothetical protein RN001_001173 [Aquatica leii]
MASFLAVKDRSYSNRVWVHNINKKREKAGEFYRLVSELRKDPKRFHMYFRMTTEEFDYLHQLIENDIKKMNTQFRRAIISEERLAVCLRFLATGNSFRSIAFSYRLGFSTVREIVKDVCDAIWKRLGPIAMLPTTQETWKRTSTRFKEMWHFPNCIGAIDGKHINIQCPINAGSSFYNYKRCHSVVLLAIVDANYNFIAINIGAYAETATVVFSVRQRWVKKMHWEKMAARFRCFRGHLEVQPDFVDKIVLASCCLHNMLCSDKMFETDTKPLNLPDGALLNLDPIRRNTTRQAFQVRENFKEYFNSDVGSVTWQVHTVRRGRIQN